MFYDLLFLWKEMLKNCTHIVDDNGVHITFPEQVFSQFEEEFNDCIVNNYDYDLEVEDNGRL